MPNTPFRHYPYSSLADAPNGPGQIQALATAVDTDVNALATTVTANTTSIAGLSTFGGTPLIGTYDPTKTIKHFVARKVGVSDGTNGLVTASTMPTGAVAVLAVTLGMNFVVGHTILFRPDLSTVASAVFQVRSSTTPFGGLVSTAYDFNHDIAYQ